MKSQRDAVPAREQTNSSQRKSSLSVQIKNNGMSTNSLPIPTNTKGKDLFDAQLWKDPVSTSVFYAFIASLRKTIREDIRQTTSTHRFIKTLRDRRKLMRCYTQNIDGLESRLNICTDLTQGRGNRSRFAKKSLEKPTAPTHNMPGGQFDSGCEVVQLHGELETLRCTLCQQTYRWKDIHEARFLLGKAPMCHFCTIANQDREHQGKRSTKVGILRPNIVLYGEEHPAADAVGSITTYDLASAPDVLLIMGTSMHVHGLKVLVKEFAKSVHARPGGKGKVIFVNHSRPSESVWKDVLDYWVSMDCDEWVGATRQHRPDIWQIQSELKPKAIKGVKKAKQISTKHIVDKVMDHDKENDGIDQVTTPQKRATVPMVVVTPKQKLPLQETPSTGRAKNSSLVKTSKTSKQSDRIAITAEACGRLDTTEESLHLPTPPSSGLKSRFHDPSRKRLAAFEEDDLLATPTKKRRTSISIWEDPSTGHRRRQVHRV